MTQLPEFILQALARPVDYSPAFSARVAALGAALSQALEAPVAHDTDMNYRAAHSLSFGSVDPALPRGPIEVRIYVSSRAELFAFYGFDLRQAYMPAGGSNHPVPLELLPAAVAADLATAREVLLRAGWREVAQELFKLPTPDSLTTLDDLPATVFEALFAEVV